MAITGSYSTSSGVNLNLVAYYSYEQDINANYSDVTVTLKLRHSKLYGSALSGSYLSVAGNSSSYSKSVSYNSTTTTETTLATKTVTVSHNQNGSGVCNIKATFVFNGTYGGKYIGTLTINENLTLKTIPRTSSITKIANSSGAAISSIDSGSVVRVYWTPAASDYKYRIQCTVSGTTYTYPSTSTYYTPGSTSAFATPASGTGTITTAHSWLPNDPSGQVSVKLYTYNSSGAQIGDPQPGTFTLNVPSNILPSINTFTATVVDGKGGYYVQGKSKVKLSVTASKGDGAANIVSYTFTGPYINGNSSSRTVSSTSDSYTVTSSILNYASTEKYYVTVTDSRRRSFKIATPISITSYQYSVPSISSIMVQRCNSDGVIDPSGTYAYVTVNSTYSPINGANTRTVVLSNSSDNYATKTTIQATSNTSNSYSGAYGGSFEIGSSYTIRATITDTAYSETNSKDAILKTAERPINFAKYGNGIAIGGMSSISSENSDGLLEVNWDTNIDANETISGSLTVNGLATLNNLTVNGSLTASDSHRIKYQIIPSGADLNDATYRAPGFYRSTSSTNSITNMPSEINHGAFELVVTGIADSSYCTQTVKDISSNTFYVRTQTSWSGGANFPTWTTWSRILTSDIPSNQYYPNYGINMNNSDLIGTNAIYFADKCDSVDEGINFVRHDGGYDVLYAADGGLFLRKNRSATPVRALTDDLMVIRRGTCTLNVSSATTVNFSSALPGVPTVMLTPLTSNSGVIAAKVRSVTASGFTAIIGGSGINDTQFAYLAIWTLQS